ncbi:4828_t:CDS:2 [Acaulospora morrowiae]|uniref:4828_t:CDS:1 n=1 Tax=Acaulospora morrowiae TaxID=94023 RepID=A0A9N9ADL0_9GLOM|nr:4828_t:CDS:2 [Acaulospora morrowiae]
MQHNLKPPSLIGFHNNKNYFKNIAFSQGWYCLSKKKIYKHQFLVTDPQFRALMNSNFDNFIHENPQLASRLEGRNSSNYSRNSFMCHRMVVQDNSPGLSMKEVSMIASALWDSMDSATKGRCDTESIKRKCEKRIRISNIGDGNVNVIESVEDDGNTCFINMVPRRNDLEEIERALCIEIDEILSKSSA